MLFKDGSLFYSIPIERIDNDVSLALNGTVRVRRSRSLVLMILKQALMTYKWIESRHCSSVQGYGLWFHFFIFLKAWNQRSKSLTKLGQSSKKKKSQIISENEFGGRLN